TTYVRDLMGNVRTRTDPNTHVTHYTFDLQERLTDTVSPLNQRWTTTYDPEGHPATATDPRGYAAGNGTGTTTYAYDAVGRLTGIAYGDSTPDVIYTFDPAGRLTTMVDGQGTTGETYTYDDAGHRTVVTRDATTITYGYDAAGRVTSRTY